MLKLDAIRKKRRGKLTAIVSVVGGVAGVGGAGDGGAAGVEVVAGGAGQGIWGSGGGHGHTAGRREHVGPAAKRHHHVTVRVDLRHLAHLPQRL